MRTNSYFIDITFETSGMKSLLGWIGESTLELEMDKEQKVRFEIFGKLLTVHYIFQIDLESDLGRPKTSKTT